MNQQRAKEITNVVQNQVFVQDVIIYTKGVVKKRKGEFLYFCFGSTFDLHATTMPYCHKEKRCQEVMEDNAKKVPKGNQKS